MKHMVILMLLSITLVFSDSSLSANNEVAKTHIATCTGSRSCYACKNCKYCGHCNAGGGTCGVCLSSVPTVRTAVKPKIKSSDSSVSSQCNGTTKKGARCKRMVKGGGYCWQHG